MGIDPVTHSPRLDLLELSSILSSSQLLNAPNLIGLGSLLNPDLLNLANTLFSCQSRNQEFNIPQNLEQNRPFQQNLLPYPVNQACTNPPAGDSNPEYLNQNQLLQANLEQFSSNPTNFSWQNVLPNLCQDNVEQFSMSKESIPTPNYGCCQQETDHNQSRIHDPFLSQYQSFVPNNITCGNIANMSFGSLLSTPSSSSTPLNSSCTTYVNASTEDERDSYCSNMLFDNLDAIGLV